MVNVKSLDQTLGNLHRSSTGENSGGPMETIVVPVLLSGKKKNSVGGPSMGTLMLKKNEVL